MKTEKIVVCVEPETKEKFVKICKQNCINQTALLNKYILEYIESQGG